MNAAAPDVAGTVFEDVAPEVARTYAEALVNAATKDGQADEAIADLEAIRDEALGPNPRFAALLASPSVRAGDKDRLISQTFEGRALPTVVRFLRVLNHHGRLGLLASITRQARATWDRRQNRVPVAVRSAVPLDDAQQAALRDRLAALTGATPILHLEVDPALIGGLVVQVGDDVYDGSVRNRLEQLRRHIVAARGRGPGTGTVTETAPPADQPPR